MKSAFSRPLLSQLTWECEEESNFLELSLSHFNLKLISASPLTVFPERFVYWLSFQLSLSLSLSLSLWCLVSNVYCSLFQSFHSMWFSPSLALFNFCYSFCLTEKVMSPTECPVFLFLSHSPSLILILFDRTSSFTISHSFLCIFSDIHSLLHSQSRLLNAQ